MLEFGKTLTGQSDPTLPAVDVLAFTEAVKRFLAELPTFSHFDRRSAICRILQGALAFSRSEVDSGTEREGVSALRSMLLESVDILKGSLIPPKSVTLREEHTPELAARTVLFNEALGGIRTVPVFDIKGTLTDYKKIYPGVREALIQACKLGNVYLISGDHDSRIVDDFLLREGFLENISPGSEWVLVPSSGLECMKNLHIYGRTGIDHRYYSESDGCFVIERISAGIPLEMRELLVTSIFPDVIEHFKLLDYFSEEKGFVCKAPSYPGYIQSLMSLDRSGLEFCPGGIPTDESRPLFRSAEVQRFIRNLITYIRMELDRAGFPFSNVMFGGECTIDIRPRGKGDIVREEILPKEEPGTIAACGGDRISQQYGNDETFIGPERICFDLASIRYYTRLPIYGQRVVLAEPAVLGGAAGALSWINEANLLKRFLFEAC